MKMKLKKEVYDGYHYNYFEAGQNRICFLFSGTGYTYDKPILYYSTTLMAELGYDVVQVNYSFTQQQFEQEPEAISKMVYNASNPIVAYILNRKSYQEVVYIGKSLGTLPLIDFYMQQEQVVPSRFVLFTPLLSLEHILPNLMGKQAFLAIGTADPHFSKEKLNKLASHHLTIIENANHSLEIVNNTLDSMLICQCLIKELKVFLQKKYR